MIEKRTIYCSMPKYAEITIDEGNERLAKHGFDIARPIAYYDDPISNMRIFSQEVDVKEPPKVEHGFRLSVLVDEEFTVGCKCHRGLDIKVGKTPSLNCLRLGWEEFLDINGAPHA